MDILFSITTGIAIKVYDDISDNKIIISETYLDLLKTFQIIGLSIISIHDFNFSLAFFMINFLSFLVDKDAYLTDYFHKSIIFLYPIFIILSFSYREIPNTMSSLYLIWFLMGLTVEPILIPEEYSQRKFLYRTLTTIFIFIGLFVGKYFNVSTSFLKLGSVCFGYGFASTLFQLYMLTQNNDNILQTLVLHG